MASAAKNLPFATGVKMSPSGGWNGALRLFIPTFLTGKNVHRNVQFIHQNIGF